MKTKYLDIHTNYHCKKAGGLFLGLRLHFPVRIYDSEAFANKHTYSDIKLTVGLLVCSIEFNIKYNYRKTLPI